MHHDNEYIVWSLYISYIDIRVKTYKTVFRLDVFVRKRNTRYALSKD